MIGNGIVARAGQVGGNGNITGNELTYLQTGVNGSITMRAGTNSGDINLPSAWLTTAKITVTASTGSINNYKFNNGENDDIKHGLITADTVNFTAKSGVSANLQATILNVSNTSAGNIDLTVAQKATSDILATVTNNNGNININSISNIRLKNVTALTTGNDINVVAAGNITVDRVKAPNNLALQTNASLTLDLDVANALWAGSLITLSADRITTNNKNRIESANLNITTINGKVNLYTKVSNLKLSAGGVGDVKVDNVADNLDISTAEINDGNLTLNTTGSLNANLIKLITTQPRTFNITSGQDMTIGVISAGLYSEYDDNGNLIGYSQVNLTSVNGAIVGIEPNDRKADVIAKKITSNSGKTVNFETAQETTGLSAIAKTGDIIIERISEKDANTLVLGDLIAMQGNVKVITSGDLVATTRIESASNGSIELTSKTGNIIVTTSITNPSDKLLKSDVLKLRATGKITIDDAVTLQGTTLLELAYGESGIIQGSVQLPKIKTKELTLELGSGSIIVSPETFKSFTDANGKPLSLAQVNLVARGNLITEGAFVGYYQYKDVNTKATYYLDTADLAEGTRVYRESGGNLTALTAAEVESLRLAPVLNTVSYQMIEEMTGRYIFTGNNGRDYYIDGYELSKNNRANLNVIPDNITVYTRQNAQGLYAYTVIDPTETKKMPIL
ncbi:MAG: hypothetical protein HC917_01040 [Richelia sp. SM2_1_7]|nr:hypothetical protein [Richelia sp. SM2_1_7]